MVKPRTLILGVDPGFQGALAFYDFETKSIVQIYDMPTDIVQGKHKSKAMVDVFELANMVGAYADQVKIAVVEEPNAMPEQGVSSTFRFGHACGLVTGVIGANLIPVFLPKPAVWKSLMGLTSNKEVSRNRVLTLFPKEAETFKRKKDEGRAEALLLAIFGERLVS